MKIVCRPGDRGVMMRSTRQERRVILAGRCLLVITIHIMSMTILPEKQAISLIPPNPSTTRDQIPALKNYRRRSLPLSGILTFFHMIFPGWLPAEERQWRVQSIIPICSLQRQDYRTITMENYLSMNG